MSEQPDATRSGSEPVDDGPVGEEATGPSGGPVDPPDGGGAGDPAPGEPDAGERNGPQPADSAPSPDEPSGSDEPAAVDDEPLDGGAVDAPSAGDAPPPADGQPVGAADRPGPPRRRRFNVNRAVVVLLLALLGFTLTVQVRHVADDPAAAALAEEDLVRILANLDAHEERVREEIRELRETRRRLVSAGESREEALAEAERRADELGVLAGTLPVVGPGITVRLSGPTEAVNAAALVDTVQELRSAGAEAMQLAGPRGPAVRVVVSTYFRDSPDGLVVDGRTLDGPYTLTVVGDPDTLAPALAIPGGVVESVQRDGGTVTVQEEPGRVEVSAVRTPPTLRHARPDS